MKHTVTTFFVLGALTLFAARAAVPIEGTWEGTKDGVRAATFTVQGK